MGLKRAGVTLDVDRYFRGSGPETVTFVYTWSVYRPLPFAGTEVYIGMKTGKEKYWGRRVLAAYPSRRPRSVRAGLPGAAPPDLR